MIVVKLNLFASHILYTFFTRQIVLCNLPKNLNQNDMITLKPKVFRIRIKIVEMPKSCDT